MSTVYDVTTWVIPGDPNTTAYTDIGKIINSIIADVKAQQTSQSSKPGAVIYIPPGDYSLKTRVTVDISYLQIKGSGHGFTSLSIRYNTSDTSNWWEIWPGASHIKVENTDGNSEAFIVQRTGNPRLSSIEFRDFCLDGKSFTPTENSYTNGKVGIRFVSDNDSCRVTGMGFVYLEHGLINNNADAFDVTDNFIAECGNCVELTGSSQASKVTNNHIGAGYIGFSVFAEGAEGLLVAGNNVFPRGRSVVHLKNSNRCVITANRFHAFYPGMIDSEGTNKENLISSNHFYRVVETFPPLQGYNNGKDDLYGLIHLVGDNNMISTNLFDYNVPTASVTPTGATPTLILVADGDSNFISNNHGVHNIATNHVVLSSTSTNTKVLDSGSTSQILSYTTSYTLRPTP
ncbi:NosD domain-containing protein [Streptomyces sp. NPDC058960]|uniref:NosD domain-containing protein n=1 Tax=Streptomyces sp. NPDC058960 TaxID=3346679 RepID=UPI0036B6B9C3